MRQKTMKVYRLTSQRKVVLDAVNKSKTHPSAEDIFELLKPEIAGLSLATVYRNLKVLAAQGKIRECEFGDGVYHYDPRLDLHGHFICESCKSINDFNLSEKTCPAHFGAYQLGTVKRGTIDFYGTCNACTEKLHD